MKGFFITVVVLLSCISLAGTAQKNERSYPMAAFTIPDTACVNIPVMITNLSPAEITRYSWSYCRDAQAGLSGKNFPSAFGTTYYPVYIATAVDQGKYYSFVSNSSAGTITLYRQNLSMLNTPARLALISLGILTPKIKGIQVVQDQGSWYGFVADSNNIVRIDFGNSLENTPVPGLSIPNANLNQAMSLLITSDAGQWIGFCTTFPGNNLIRIGWPDGLNNAWTYTNLGNTMGLNNPKQAVLDYSENTWTMLVSNSGNNSITRLTFGPTLMNNNPSVFIFSTLTSLDNNQGIGLVKECDKLAGYVVNQTTSSNSLVKLIFPDGIGGNIVTQAMGNIAEMADPSTFCATICKADTSFLMVPNFGNSSLSLIYSVSCQTGPNFFSKLPDPDPVPFPDTGIYQIMLMADSGLASQQSVCRKIVIVPPITYHLGNDTTICTGQPLTLDAGPGYSQYLWSTGETTQTILIQDTGTYSIEVTNKWNCKASDSLHIGSSLSDSSAVDTAVCHGGRYFVQGAWQTKSGIYYDTLKTVLGCDSIIRTNLSFAPIPSDSSQTDTTICFGQRYYAQGTWQTQSGIFYDTLKSVTDCDSVIKTILTVKPEIPVDLGRDTILCPGQQLLLNAYVANASAYLWQDGSTDSAYLVHHSGTYWVHVTIANCQGGDTLSVGDCPAQLWIPNSFTPNGDGLNDYFLVYGISISRFSIMIFDRWGAQQYAGDDINQGWDGIFKGSYCPPGVYSYLITFEVKDAPGEMRKEQGTITLVR